MNRPRRTLVALVLALLAGNACSAPGSQGSVSVMSVWTGAEEQQFKRVLDAFTEKTGIQYNYQGTRALSQVVLSSVQGGNPPDVAVLATPGDLARYARAGALHPLDDVLDRSQRDAYGDQWLMPLEINKRKNIYAVPVKANLKSLVWFNPGHPAQPTPRTWDDLVGYGPWCLGVGDPPSSGWPGSDFIEDILLHRSGSESYQMWAAGDLAWTSDQVTTAWTLWGELVTRRGVPVLLTDWADAGRGMFAQPPRCVLEHQASFVMGAYQGYRDLPTGLPRPGEDFDFFSFPALDPAVGPVWEASADFAAMFNNTPQARELMGFLATEEAQRIWPSIGEASAFTANKRVDETVYDDPVSQRVARILRGGDTKCLDAADFMPAPMRNAFYRAVLEYLSNPERLDALLTNLEALRNQIPDDEWVDLPCGQ